MSLSDLNVFHASQCIWMQTPCFLSGGLLSVGFIEDVFVFGLPGSDMERKCDVLQRAVASVPEANRNPQWRPVGDWAGLFATLKKEKKETNYCSVQFKMVSLRLERPIRAPPLSHRSFRNIAFETVPIFVSLMMALSHPFKEDCLALPLSTPLSSWNTTINLSQ